MSNQNKKRIRAILKFVLEVIVVVILMSYFSGEKRDYEEITYDKVISYVKANEVAEIQSQQGSLEIWLTLKDGTVNKALVPSNEEFVAFISEEIESGAEIEFVVKKMNTTRSTIISLITSLGSYVLIFFLFIKMMSKMTDGKYEIKATESKVRFSDVAGIDEEKAQLEEIVKFLKCSKEYISSGARIPKGILLNGEPGTGKTLLAKAIAGEAGVSFFQMNGSSFEEKYVGVGASRIRELFKKAKENAPCIIFIDEIDSVAQNRYSGKSYSEQTLNQLLAEMDGFETKDNVIVIAATNHIEVLDEALIRPGRFDRHVYVPMPDVIAREKILEVHAKNKQFMEDVSLSEIAKKTVGFSGADLENVLNEAAIYSVNNGNKLISNEAIDESIARVLVGLKKKNSAITEADKRLTAIHEAGHAIVSAVVRPDVKNFGISIVPRGNAGGYNFFDESNKTYQRKKDLIEELQVLYGGRIAEDLILNDISTGASNDLEKATKIAHRMLTRFAMNGSLLTKISGEGDFNAKLDSIKMDELEKVCKEAYDNAYAVVKEHRQQLLELADLLMEKEYLSQEDVEKFMSEKI